MKAGKMDERLWQLKPVIRKNETGEKVPVFIRQGTCPIWAERVKYIGSMNNEAREYSPRYSADFNVRIEHPVTDGWRVEDSEGNIYMVRTHTDYRRQGFKTLHCERPNE